LTRRSSAWVVPLLAAVAVLAPTALPGEASAAVGGEVKKCLQKAKGAHAKVQKRAKRLGKRARELRPKSASKRLRRKAAKLRRKAAKRFRAGRRKCRATPLPAAHPIMPVIPITHADAGASDGVDTGAPDTEITNGPAGVIAQTSTSFSFRALHGSGESAAGASFECSLDSAGFAACSSPQGYDALGAGAHTFQVRARDAAGNVDPTPARRDFEVVPPGANPPPVAGPANAPAPGPNDPAPPHPEDVAPALDPTEATSVGAGTRFLYESPDPIQEDVEDDVIDELQVSVLRGQVSDGDGNPLVGVRVTVLDHPEFGHTATRVDGGFDLAVNGGGTVTLEFEREGFIPVQRLVEETSWGDFVPVDDVIMVPPDEKSNEIDLSSDAQTQIAQSTSVSDGEGQRRSTLVFEQGTDAVMEMPGGSLEPLDEITVRSTEYTVGEDGLDAMPGELPPSTAFTYAVELSIDEAVSAGATDIRFDKPVVNYTDNFLDFPVGTEIPTGYYDRELGKWLGGPDGRVIEVVGEAGGLAEVDVDGDGQADDDATLQILGIDSAERTRLALLYDPGKSLWRVEVTHFTPWDYNWPYGPPGDAEAPENGPPEQETESDEPCEAGGSIIHCENQVLGERFGVLGTEFTLNYASDRVPARTSASTLDIPLTDGSVPASLEAIDLRLEFAGRTIEEELPPDPESSYRFTWDGQDAYGRNVQGSIPVTIRIGYRYGGVYQEPEELRSSWSRFAGTPIVGSPSREAVVFEQKFVDTVGAWDAARGVGLGGWTLSAHHSYDPVSGILHYGDGGRRSVAQNPVDEIRTIAGHDVEELGPGFSGDGGPAFEAQIDGPRGIVAAPDGSLYFADTENDRIRRISADGEISTVAGSGVFGFAGDGGPGVVGRLASPRDVALAPDGSLLIADSGNNRIRKLAIDGQITTLAGGGSVPLGDDGPAGEARLANPAGVAAAPDGTVYIADTFHNRLRMVSPDGTISTVAGDGIPGARGDGGSANEARLRLPRDVAVGEDGSVYVADTGNGLIRRVRLDGVIETVAGGGTFEGEDGAAATEALLIRPTSVAVTQGGAVLIADEHEGSFGFPRGRVWAVDGDGLLQTIAGGGRESGEGVPALDTFLTPYGVTSDPEGAVYVTNRLTSRISRVEGLFRSFTVGTVDIPSEDGSQVFRFNGSGRHLATLDALTGVASYTFEYDSAGRLSAVERADGRRTTIERGPDGGPIAIEASGGQRTALSVNGNGYLSGIENPAGEAVTMSYLPGGLLAGVLDPLGGESSFEYDTEGRLVSDENAEGHTQALSRTELANGHEVTLTGDLGSEVSYRVESLPGGGLRRTTVDRVGAESTTTFAADGSVTMRHADGIEIRTELAPDPRFGLRAPLIREQVESTPHSLQRETSQERTVELSNPSDPLSVSSLFDSVTVNGDTSTMEFDADTRTIVQTTAEGRSSETALDELGRAVSTSSAPGQAPREVTFDGEGRVESVEQGDQALTYAYDQFDRVETRTNAAGEAVEFEYDDADRVVALTLPSGDTYTYSYDDNGNRVGIGTPEGHGHQFQFTPTGQEEGYAPPGLSPGYTRGYDAESKLQARTFPSGAEIDYQFDAGQRLSGRTAPGESSSFEYVGQTGRFSRAERTPQGGGAAQGIEFGHDGALVTRTEFGGPASGEFTYSYDEAFRVTGTTLTSGSDVLDLTIARDADGLPTAIGPFAVTRAGPAGAVTELDDGALVTEFAYDSLGRVAERAQSGAGEASYELDLSYDSAGRIAQRVETVDGATSSFEYTYDLNGQLLEVERDGAVVEAYVYDRNGNRISSELPPSPSENAAYDEQDRLTSFAGTSYAFGADGFLQQRGGDMFDYGSEGQLLEATVGGATVSYRYDAFGRRVNRTEGAEETEYLYGDPGDAFLVNASRDPSGQLSRYYYDQQGFLFAMERGGERFNVATDQVGTPKVVTDSEGDVVKTVARDSLGRLLSDSNPAFELPIGFAGGIEDGTTGLVRFGLRDYDPHSGRFTAKDPSFFEGSPYNLYRYAGNDPVNFRDPTGLYCVGASGGQPVGLHVGGSACIDETGASACVRAGFGVGGPSGDVDLTGSPQQTGVYSVFEFNIGTPKSPFRINFNHRKSLTSDCPPVSSISGQIGPFKWGDENGLTFDERGPLKSIGDALVGEEGRKWWKPDAFLGLEGCVRL
jgi:RHS repeat-associated protein